MQEYINLARFNAISFFYQLFLYPDYCYMFTIVTQQSQKTFQVPIINYINSTAFVQHKIDNILHIIWNWAKAYINDIIYGKSSLKNLLRKLRILFEIFLYYNIFIKPTKSYFNYFDIGFFGQ